MALSDIDVTQAKYFELNNQINIPKNGQIQIDKDQAALADFLATNVKPNTKTFNSVAERLTWLIDHDYLEADFIHQYPMAFIERLYQYLTDQDFHFQSFMAAYKFYAQYALKTDDKEFYMNSIGRVINSALQLSKIGGGVGISLTNLREAGAPIKKIKGASSGVVPVMKLLEDTFSYSNQLGQRQGAGVVYLSVFHPDIIDFLGAKKENADEKVRIKTLSLGITVPDKFYELVEANADMYLFSPYDVEKVYGQPFAYVDITAEYDRMVANPAIHKVKVNARSLEDEISKLQQESGYPYIVNIDTENRANPIAGRIIMSNLCSEIAQVQTPSQINDDQTYAHLGTDVSCNLGSTNVANLMETPDFGQSIQAMVRALTYISDIESLATVPTGTTNCTPLGSGRWACTAF